MEEKRPIDRKRDSGGQADIASEEDGAIVEMKNIGGRLFVLKERAIYEVIMADAIDPKRTNFDLPKTVHKLIIDQGVESEVVSRTFLTANAMFRKEFVSKEVDCDALIVQSIDLLAEVAILESEIRDFKEIENRLTKEYEERKKQNVSFKLPSIVKLVSRCKTIFQKADHVEQILMDIIRVFYPNDGLTKQSHFPKFHEVLTAKYGEGDSFSGFIGETLYFMRVVRELRNGFDHRLEHTKVTDFDLQMNGDVIAPTIELKHKEVKLERTSLSQFLDTLIENVLYIVETTFAYLAGRNQRLGGMPVQLKWIPEQERRNEFIKYGYWLQLGGTGSYV